MPIRRRGALCRRHPERRHRVPEPSPSAFELLVGNALDGLPEPFRRLLDGVAVVIEDEPTLEHSRDARGRPLGPYGLYGLYEGTPLIEYGADLVPFPNKITLFRLALEDDFPDPAQLAEEVRKTVVHELAHHAGFGEDRLRELDFE